MNQRIFWSNMLIIICSVFVISVLVDEIMHPRGFYFVSVLVFLLLYGWIVCNMYSKFLIRRISFDKYRNILAVVVAIPYFVSLLWHGFDFLSSLRPILLFLMLYSFGILNIFGYAFQLIEENK
jgi:hypothetical protein